jgi:large subunit ribosomal protein L29
MARPTEALRELSDGELDERLVEARAELFNLRFQLATGKQSNSARLGLVRKDIARVITLQREREIAAAEALAAGSAAAVRESAGEEGNEVNE